MEKTQAASDSDAAPPRQTQTNNDASGNPQCVKKCPDWGLRRGRSLTSQTAFGGQLPYKGSLVSPVVRFHYSPFEYNGRLLRATNHEPRATAFFLGLRCGVSPRQTQYYITTVCRPPQIPAMPRIHAGRPLGVSYKIFLLVVNATEMFLSFCYTLHVLDKSCEF